MKFSFWLCHLTFDCCHLKPRLLFWPQPSLPGLASGLDISQTRCNYAIIVNRITTITQHYTRAQFCEQFLMFIFQRGGVLSQTQRAREMFKLVHLIWNLLGRLCCIIQTIPKCMETHISSNRYEIQTICRISIYLAEKAMLPYSWSNCIFPSKSVVDCIDSSWQTLKSALSQRGCSQFQ